MLCTETLASLAPLSCDDRNLYPWLQGKDLLQQMSGRLAAGPFHFGRAQAGARTSPAAKLGLLPQEVSETWQTGNLGVIPA